MEEDEYKKCFKYRESRQQIMRRRKMFTSISNDGSGLLQSAPIYVFVHTHCPMIRVHNWALKIKTILQVECVQQSLKHWLGKKQKWKTFGEKQRSAYTSDSIIWVQQTSTPLTRRSSCCSSASNISSLITSLFCWWIALSEGVISPLYPFLALFRNWSKF